MIEVKITLAGAGLRTTTLANRGNCTIRDHAVKDFSRHVRKMQ